MRFGVRQDQDTLEVRAMEGGHVLGKLDAQKLSWRDIAEHANELALEAQETAGHQRAQLMAQARRYDRCARAFDRLQAQVRRDDLQLFTVVSATWEGPDWADNVAKLYRVAAVTAGRRGAALIAEPCAEHLFGRPPAGYQAPKVAWRHPEFRRGLLIDGPVVFYPHQVAYGRAANRKRTLL